MVDFLDPFYMASIHFRFTQTGGIILIGYMEMIRLIFPTLKKLMSFILERVM